MGNVADKVRAAPDIKEALVALAEAIDALREQPAAPAAADPFMAWDRSQGMDALRSDYSAPAKPTRDEAAIAAVKEQLVTATGDDQRALEAKLRLLQDDGIIVDVAPSDGARPDTTFDDAGNATVDLPPATPARQGERVAFCVQHKLWEFQTGSVATNLDEDTFTDTYAKGGPAWFYYGDRKGVLSLPIEVRQAMIADIAEDSTSVAQELGRDVLMNRDAQDQSNTPAMNA